MIEEYQLVHSDNAESLTEQVNAAIRLGWEPHGSPVITEYTDTIVGIGYENHQVVFAQAMVRDHR